MTFNEEDEDTLVEEGPQIERGTVFLRDTCHREIYQRNIRDKRLPREACFDQGDVKVEKDIMIFNEEEDEDTLVEEGPQIERGTVFHRDTCHREIHQRNIRDKRFPREACFDLGDVKWTKDSVTINEEEEDEDILVEEGPQIERGTVFLRDTCHREIHRRNIRDKRFPREACFEQGDVKVEKDISMKRRMKTPSWRKDLKLKAARCFTGTHATVRFTRETFVTSGSRVKRVLTWAMSKWRTSLLPFVKRRMKTFSWRKDLAN